VIVKILTDVTLFVNYFYTGCARIFKSNRIPEDIFLVHTNNCCSACFRRVLARGKGKDE
jgi:hypothetical protein